MALPGTEAKNTLKQFQFHQKVGRTPQPSCDQPTDYAHPRKDSMKLTKIALPGATAMALAAIALLGVMIRTPRVQAFDADDEESKIQIGYQIAPVVLNLKGKNPRLVGYGSYIVNATADCNGCHTGGGPPNFNYASGGNPYFGQKPVVVDPTVYLSGGDDFGPVGTPTGPSGYAGPDIISRNLTPDKTGRPEGGNTLAQFKQIIRHGTDFDNLHPNCTSVSPTPTPANCIPTGGGNNPVGGILQIMPWPTFSHLTDHDIEAIYEYLSAIPCIEGPAKVSDLPPQMQYAFPVLHNDCH